MNVEETNKATFQRISDSLYRRGSTIFARVRINGRQTWRSTGTNEPRDARKWLKKWRNDDWLMKNGIEPNGVVLQRERLTVGALIDAYLEAGMPTRKMQKKAAATIQNELACLKPIRRYFGDTAAATVTLADCDKYRDWRLAGGYFSDEKGLGKNPKTARLKKGSRSVDLELTIFGNVFNLSVRRAVLKANPLLGRGRYSRAEEIRHCREVAPTPEGLKQIEYWLRARNEQTVADLVCFLAYSGLRIGEALPLDWEAVDWGDKVLHVQREKRGIMPWVPILPEMETLLLNMQKGSASHLLFPSPFDSNEPRDDSAVRHRITAACEKLGLGHVTPHGLRSYFVTRAREGGLSDAEIAMLIGDKTGPAIIAQTYGDVRPDHLLKQAQRIRLTVASQEVAAGSTSSIKSSNASPEVAASFKEALDTADFARVASGHRD